LAWLLILLVVFVALAPLIAMMPTPRQRRLSRLRQAARERGMKVQLRPAPPLLRIDDSIALYSRPLVAPPEVQLLPGEFFRDHDGWRRRAGQAPHGIADCLQGLPGDVNYLVVEQRSVGVFWEERGDLEQLENIDRILGRVIDELRDVN
jgi:hypothetical protein